MDKIIVEGGRALRGEVNVSGAKNAALPILVSSLLSDGLNTYTDVPDLQDVNSTKILLDHLGAAIETDGHTVRIQHLAALYNCCPEPITYDIEIGDATVLIEEQTQSPCDCDCCMDTELVLTDFPPGHWILTFRWFDIEIWDWVTDSQQIYVPDVGQQHDPVIAAQTVTDCLTAVGAPESLDPSMARHTWGRIKARYR